ncbi:UNVERIFIED_CONTAM: hypothetical protein PYX00_008698 [Menopon gallinae]|uniref:Conserved oligomeric Golgi complex subunit 1 n=1 Tax=Menopon gallinae TaxID=328185 RepID=A0AAW2HP27_9NEOP
MSLQSLVVINSDKLFEENGIDRIKAIQLQIQNEIEKKREELRTMVGERYRDLLKAADTITEMKITAASVINRINRTEALCKAHQLKKGLCLKQTEKISRTADDLGDVSKIIEIKILLSLPEEIWIAIDNKNYLTGAELFLFATHIHFGINVSPNAKLIKEEYPVVSKQWEVITSYRNILINGAHNQLKQIDLPYENASECLTAIILLDAVSFDKLIDQYLALRMSKLEEILYSDELTRSKLRLIIMLIHNTLSTVYHCFIAESDIKCLISKVIEKTVGENTKPTLAKITQAMSLPDHYLSPMIREFHPKVKKDLTCLSTEAVQNRIRSWLERVDEVLNTELTKLLMLLNDIKRLHKIIKEDVLNVQCPDDWKMIVSTLLCTDDLNIYKAYMEKMVTRRVLKIIENVWNDSITSIMSSLKDIDEEISKERVKQLECDIRWFVWKENIMDGHESLRLKTQGFTTRVMRLCNCLENSLKQLLEDVELYVGRNILETKPNIRLDAVQILVHLHTCSSEMIETLACKITESCKKGGNPISESAIIVRARFLQALVVQCPSLEKCLKLGQRQHVKDILKKSRPNEWTHICSFLNGESTQVWQMWKELTSGKLRNLIRSKLSSKISLRTLLASKPLNEVINIEEQTEDGTKVQSDIHVPSQPSLPLQDLLFQACQLLNSVVPHTLPREIHQDLVDGFVRNILEHYEEWSKSETIYQSQAWQMLFDVRLITLLLITRDNKDLSQSICEVLEKIIDPFDLDVHYPHLQNSVKKSTQRLQGTVGVLINFREKLPVFNGLKLTQNASSTKVEEPNILAMSDKIPWFTLLAVANQTSDATVSKDSTPEKSVKVKEREGRKESKSRDFVKSANAFLNAMTSRWS